MMGRKIIGLVAGATVVTFLVVAPYVVNAFYIRILTEVLIFGLFATSINILVGYTGLPTLGHAGIFGVSAYAVGYFTVRAEQPLWVVIPAALLAALVVSVLFGAMAVRTSGIYFLMITLAQGMIVWGLAFRWFSVTGAENGIAGIVRPEILAPYWVYYWFVLAVVALMIVSVHKLKRSCFGLTLQGIREREARMASLGYHVVLHKFLSFMAAGSVAGVAGILFAYHNNFVSPIAVEFTSSAEGILMVILGSAGTLLGPLVGSTVIVFTRQQVSLFTDRWLMILGGIFVITMLVAPEGLVTGARRLAVRVFGRPPRPSPVKAEPQELPAGTGVGREKTGEGDVAVRAKGVSLGRPDDG